LENSSAHSKEIDVPNRRTDQDPSPSPVKGLRLIPGDAVLRHLRERLEVALEQGLHEVARLVLGVAVGDVHHEGLDHQSPWPAVDDLGVDGEDGGVVLQRKMASTSISYRQRTGKLVLFQRTLRGARITTSSLRFRQVTSRLHYPNAVHVTMATCCHR